MWVSSVNEFAYVNGKQFYSINVQLICEIAPLEIWEAYLCHYSPFDVIILSWSRIKGSVLLHMDVRWTRHGAAHRPMALPEQQWWYPASHAIEGMLHCVSMLLTEQWGKYSWCAHKLAQHGSLLLSCDCRKDWWELGWTDMLLSLWSKHFLFLIVSCCGFWVQNQDWCLWRCNP